MRLLNQKITLQTPDRIKLVGILTKMGEKNGRLVILCHGITADKNEEGIFVEL